MTDLEVQRIIDILNKKGYGLEDYSTFFREYGDKSFNDALEAANKMPDKNVNSNGFNNQEILNGFYEIASFIANDKNYDQNSELFKAVFQRNFGLINNKYLLNKNGVTLENVTEEINRISKEMEDIKKNVTDPKEAMSRYDDLLPKFIILSRTRKDIINDNFDFEYDVNKLYKEVSNLDLLQETKDSIKNICDRLISIYNSNKSVDKEIKPELIEERKPVINSNIGVGDTVKYNWQPTSNIVFDPLAYIEVDKEYVVADIKYEDENVLCKLDGDIYDRYYDVKCFDRVLKKENQVVVEVPIEKHLPEKNELESEPELIPEFDLEEKVESKAVRYKKGRVTHIHDSNTKKFEMRTRAVAGLLTKPFVKGSSAFLMAISNSMNELPATKWATSIKGDISEILKKRKEELIARGGELTRDDEEFVNYINYDYDNRVKIL